MTQETVDDYSASIRRLAELESDEWISNGKPEHAAALYHTFFSIAKNKIQIFCRNLAREVFDNPDIISAAQGAIRRGVEMHIILQEPPEDNNAFYAMLGELQSSGFRTVIVRIFEDHKFSKTIKPNFCVVDGKAIRYEANSEHVKAVASMNRPDAALKLSSYFEIVRSMVA